MTMPCFRNAQGFGTTTTQGRAGPVVRVTNFDEVGLGSYKDAVNVAGPSNTYFSISGTINRTGNALKYNTPFKRISGQTSPGGVAFSGEEHQVRSHDLLLECLRIRTGDVDDPGSGWDNRDCINYGSPDDQFGVYPFSTYNVVNRRCSYSWSVDENCTAWYATHDVSWIECISFEGLWFSNHPKTKGPPFNPHSMGMLHGIGAHNLSYYRCAIGSCNQRNPQLAGVIPGIAPGAYCVDVRNCFIWNWGQEPLAVEHAGNHTNLIGLYFRKGPNYADGVVRCIRLANDADAPGTELYVEDVIGPGNEDGLGDPWNTVKRDDGNAPNPGIKMLTPHSCPTMTTIAAKDVPDSVLATVGARRPRQDKVDARAIAQAQRRCWPADADLEVDSVAEAGGWDVFSGGAPSLDSNDDGVPDYYASAHGFGVMTNIGDQDAGDGETWVGHYLDDLMDGTAAP